MEKNTVNIPEMNEGIRCLHEEFTSRSQKNARYSLRAFAKHLGVSHTLLSLIMAGKRPLTLKTAKLVSERLELPPEKAVSLMRAGAEAKVKNYNYKYEYLDLKTFDLISDWVHFAILSLMETTQTLVNSKWIAKRLGINETQAKVSFQRLLDVGLIAEKDGRWCQTGKPIKVIVRTPATRVPSPRSRCDQPRSIPARPPTASAAARRMASWPGSIFFALPPNPQKE